MVFVCFDFFFVSFVDDVSFLVGVVLIVVVTVVFRRRRRIFGRNPPFIGVHSSPPLFPIISSSLLSLSRFFRLSSWWSDGGLIGGSATALNDDGLLDDNNERCWSWDCGVNDDTAGSIDCTRHIVRMIAVDGRYIIFLLLVIGLKCWSICLLFYEWNRTSGRFYDLIWIVINIEYGGHVLLLLLFMKGNYR